MTTVYPSLTITVLADISASDLEGDVNSPNELIGEWKRNR